jgi:hypothetical protein
MSEIQTVPEQKTEQVDEISMLKLVTAGDLAGLSSAQKLAVYRARCDAAGLDPRTAPFQFIRLQGRETLYATKTATDQLTRLHKITTSVLSQSTEDDIRVVMVRAAAADGRGTDDMGAVPVAGLKGADLANAYMKAISKAKRRAVLSLCGLGMIDETELEDIHEAQPDLRMPEATGPAADAVQEGVVDALPDAAAIGPVTMQLQAVRIEPHKHPGGGFVYDVHVLGGKVYTTTEKPLAVGIKKAIEAGQPVSCVVIDGQIVGLAPGE